MHSPPGATLDFRPATKPTMYFIGVTTAQSSIHRIFPRWAEQLGLGECALRGWDFPLHAQPAQYRAAIECIKRDPLSVGALVTTHKVAVFHACQGQFDAIEPLSRSLGEISSIAKRGGGLHGRSVDPWTAGYALDAFLPRDHWRSGAEVLVLGAGGAGTALVWQLAESRPASSRPRRIHAADKAAARLAHLQGLHATWRGAVPLTCHQVADTHGADELLSRLPPGSLVVNATGLGKDAPGSPLSPGAVFPERAFAWDFNYRGDLGFLAQARAQQAARALHIEDGWVYFVHGWLQVMADIFEREIPTGGPLFDELARLAAAGR